ncbi:MAG TPA: RNA methyltransferase [Bacteroidales bacterium]
MNFETKKELLEYLLSFITDSRYELFKKVVSQRTRYITVVLEDIYQPHNASAVLRTCDLTGVQDVHIIENQNTYEVNPEVAMGSSKWLNLVKYNGFENNTEVAFNQLRQNGYRIIATTPHKNDKCLEDISLDKKMAFVFGTEMHGLSENAIRLADEYVRIPMVGFTESYNISVSAALVLYTLTQKLRNSNVDWQLNEIERVEILLEWTKRSINRPELLEKQFLKKIKDVNF